MTVPRRAAPWVALIFIALLGSCAPRRTAPPANTGYPEVPAAATAPAPPVAGGELSGRRILLDPGHGGVFRGVIGRDGLDEATVNLDVALRLRDLLSAAGAEVALTRTSDADLLTPADSTVNADLAARASLCAALRPDVFVSLHHNSNAQLDRTLNETQTYHPVGRTGADLDLARAVHKHLVQALRISPARIMAGNFHVLRAATAPAVLGEPSMLSNPDVEARLAQPRFRQLEAEAYFQGLREYFAGGVPAWTVVSDTTLQADEHVAWRFVADRIAPDDAPPLDPASVTLLVDGIATATSLSPAGDVVVWRPERPLPDGDYRCELRARNLAGRTAELTFDLRRRTTPRRIEVTRSSERGVPAPRSLLHWRALDGATPAPLRETVRIGGAGGPADSLTLAPLGAAEGWLLLPAAAHVSPAEAAASLPAGARWIWLGAGGWNARLLPGIALDERRDDAFAVDRRAPAFPVAAGSPAWLEKPGCRPLLLDADHRTPWQPSGAAPPDSLHWTTLIPALVGRRILIDPHGGAAEADGFGPLGTSGRELNLGVAERLAGLLCGAGADARLTRTDEAWVPPEAKVLQANALGAELFLTLRRAPDGGWGLAHHPGSAGGLRAARLLQETLPAPAGTAPPAIAESYDYLLRQTACPAVAVSLPLPATVADEERGRAPSHQLGVATGIFNAVAAWFAGRELLADLRDPRELLLGPTPAEGPAAAPAWVRVDGNWLWLPPLAGDPPARLPLPGADHTFEVHAGGAWELLATGRGADGAPAVRTLWSGSSAPGAPSHADGPLR
ncbi:MAG: N-acetylmuramoyl-L-alanine amidase [bacterium]|nr:N-acetylmuramoyl-L-alanine amidase [bacterium]